MRTKLLFILIAFLPTSLIGQSIAKNDSSYQRIVQEECDDRVYTKMEVLPSLKIKKEAFEDTLASYLKAKMTFEGSSVVKYRFVVTTNSHILDIQKESGDVANEIIVKEAMVYLSDLWLPAKQNNHNVCAYVRIEIFFQKDKLKVFISK